ncbi:hypothetical protein PR048_010896 [Dryococelus australis]|uniref:Reverse transcriptase domain-containing protein n=1 Tax=Dryococelus australis TaxID=614101 RepID=A0ABQ9I418_9NEOP|nr:hypothetical protein PR048_010896 [Dryococelus australis]
MLIYETRLRSPLSIFRSFRTGRGTAIYVQEKYCAEGRELHNPGGFDNAEALAVVLTLTFCDSKGGPSNSRPSAIDLTIVSTKLLGIMDWRVHEENWGSDHFPVITSSRLGQAVHRPLYYDYLKLHTESADWRIFVSFVNEHIDELPNVTEDTVLMAYDAFHTFLLSAARHLCQLLILLQQRDVAGPHGGQRNVRKRLHIEFGPQVRNRLGRTFASPFRVQHRHGSYEMPSSHIKRRTPALTDYLVKKWMAYIAPDFVPPISSLILPSFRQRQVSNSTHIWGRDFTDSELQYCLSKTRDSAPGNDAIPLESSYRPIALRSCLTKIFEILIKYKLSWWLEGYKLIRPEQIGFRQGVSSIDALAMLLLLIHLALQNRRILAPLFWI